MSLPSRVSSPRKLGKNHNMSTLITLLNAFGVHISKKRSAANKEKNRRARGLRRTKAEGRKLDSIYGRYQNVARNISTDRDQSGLSEFDRLHASPEVLDATVKPAHTAASILARNIDRERQGKRPIKSPYGEDFPHAAEVMSNTENPGDWTPAQQRLMTDAEKGQQRAISRVGEQKIKAEKERQSGLKTRKKLWDSKRARGEES